MKGAVLDANGVVRAGNGAVRDEDATACDADDRAPIDHVAPSRYILTTMMHAEIRVGRLLEVRATLPLRLEEIPALVQMMKDILDGTSGLLVAILDARNYGVEPPAAADHFLSVIKRDNPRVERSAFLIDRDQAMLGLQLDRLIREAGNPRRRLFRSVAEATGFLEPVLTPDERERLDVFLAA